MTIEKRLKEDPEIHAALRQLMESGDWARYEGSHLRELTQQLSTYHGRAHVQLCCSGTIAVEIALRGLQIGPGDEVLLSAYDFPGNFRAIEAIGARPVLIDLAANTWTIDLEQLDQAYSPSVRAVLISHLHGTFTDMHRLTEWCREKGLTILEDACQAHGAHLQGRIAGSWGDVSVTSFGGSKLISSGRGGALFTDDPRIDQRMRIYRDRGNDAFAMSELQACVLAPQWRQLKELNQRRWERIQALEQRLSPLRSISLAQRNPNDHPAFYKWGFQVRGESDESVARRRDELLHNLQSIGIECGEGFRGFYRRTGQRCRKIGNLDRARAASLGTILVHHSLFISEDDPSNRWEAMIEVLLKTDSAFLR